MYTVLFARFAQCSQSRVDLTRFQLKVKSQTAPFLATLQDCLSTTDKERGEIRPINSHAVLVHRAVTRHQGPRSTRSLDPLQVQPNYSNHLIQNSLCQQVNNRVFRLLVRPGRGLREQLSRLTRNSGRKVSVFSTQLFQSTTA